MRSYMSEIDVSVMGLRCESLEATFFADARQKNSYQCDILETYGIFFTKLENGKIEQFTFANLRTRIWAIVVTTHTEAAAKIKAKYEPASELLF